MKESLSISVDGASRPLRAFLVLFFLLAGSLAAWFVWRLILEPGWPATIIAILFLQPFVTTALLAALYVVAPHSRFGDLMAIALPKSRRGVFVLPLWAAGAIVTAVLELLVSS